tara:strand:+ start:36 stop:548 length:513 start_codon:yes stop_codon:yes gene_type:complete
MFKEGNLVRHRDEMTNDNLGVMRVLETRAGMPQEAGNILVATENDDRWYREEELDLVAESIDEQEPVEMRPNVPGIDPITIHDQFNKYIVSVIHNLRAKGCDNAIHIMVECDHFSGDEAEISYQVRLRHGEWVESDHLGKSANIAWERFQQDEGLKTKAIPFFVEDQEDH